MTQQIKRTQTVNMDTETKPWAKLIPLSKGLPEHEAKQDSIVIGRNPQCDIVINDKRLSGKHCRIFRQVSDNKVFVQDMSTNGTFIQTSKIGKGKKVEIQHNTEIWLLPVSKVKPDQTFGYKLFMQQIKKQVVDKQHEDKQQKIKDQKKQQQDKKNSDFAQSIKDQITCSFCFEIMCIPVSVQPCNHRFCGGCLTELVQKKKDQCIQCRKQITSAMRDSAFNSIIDDYLKSHPDQKRDPADQQANKKRNIFGHQPFDIYAKIHGKKKKPQKAVSSSSAPRRGRVGRRAARNSDLSASDDDGDGRGRCRQCDVVRDGFQCSSSQVHIGCFTCGKLMAQRADPNLHQSCLLCTNNFCNLYYPPCTRGGVQLRLVKDRKQQCKVDAQLLRGNKFEFESLRNFLLLKKLSSKDIFTFMMNQYFAKDKFSYVIDRKIQKVPPVVSRQIKMNPQSAVCDLCWKDLWFQIVLVYRMEVASQMPDAVKNRPVCYWGVNCRTMDHKDDHAKRFNHMVFQSRF